MNSAGIVCAESVLAQVEELIGEIAPLTKSAAVLRQTAEFLSRIDGVARAGAYSRLDKEDSVWIGVFGEPPRRRELQGLRNQAHYVAESGKGLAYYFADPSPAPDGVDVEAWDSQNIERLENGEVDISLLPLKGTSESIGSFWICGDRPEGLEPRLGQALEVLGSVVAMTLEKIDSVDQAAGQLEEISSVHKRLEASNRDFQSFAQMASSDLQDPLRKIISFGDRLERSAVDQLTERELDYLTRIHNASDRMQRLINDLLTFASVHTGESEHEVVDLELVVIDVLSDLEVAISESGAVVKIGTLPSVEGNATQLRQLFQNLIGNAIKFRASGVEPRIVVGLAESTSSSAVIEVSDNGIGFDAKFLDKIFRPFQRLHGTSEYSGSGIGLSVCKRIVNRHGGWLGARSLAGEGATFLVHFPDRSGASYPEGLQ